jgi:hypothetical protein
LDGLHFVVHRQPVKHESDHADVSFAREYVRLRLGISVVTSGSRAGRKDVVAATGIET